MDIVVKQGKAFYWGTSEWSAADIMRADTIARQYNLTPPSMEQPEYNMFSRARVEKEYLPIYKELGYGTTIFSPLASRLLNGKYANGIPADSRATLAGYEWLQKYVLTPERIEKAKQLQPIANDLGVSMAQMALAWTLKCPYVSTTITGASRAEQVHENMKALDVVAMLTDDVMARIEDVMGNNPNAE
jgi:aryl-alcohol dehydrogenase-like predicted oxidoreductase